MKIGIRTFYVRYADRGYDCNSFVIDHIKGPLPALPHIGSTISADDLVTIVANGNKVVAIPARNSEAMMQDGRWRKAKEGRW